VDALATFRAGWILAIFTADCVPLLMADPVRRVIGAAHAGREGTLRGVGRLCLAAMLDHGAKADAVRAHIGPSICASHYEVGAEMAVDFRKRFGHYEGAVKGPERRHLNLPLINRLELLEAGVRPEHIEIEARCTVEHPDLFCSHRRDGLAAGRMISFLALQAGK
jgi:YfiH family protein